MLSPRNRSAAGKQYFSLVKRHLLYIRQNKGYKKVSHIFESYGA